jgi:two-component system, sensor histidine kinase RegB
MTHADESDQTAWYLAATPTALATWLSRLWWTTVAIDAIVVVASFFLSASVFPLRRVAPLVAANALINAEMAMRVSGPRSRSRFLTGAALLVQVVLLTGLLELSGGPSNPFSVIYAVQIALAALTLGSRWAYLTAVLSVLSYGLLISWHLEELVPAHHRLVDFPTHLFTMWLAMVTLFELAAHFAGAASRAIAHREAALDAMRQQASRAERVMSLTTLAAGAAHELSTPLATIAIASKELERALARASLPPDCADDARLIREEVDRCQLILDQMSGRAGGVAADVAETVSIGSLLADVRARLPVEQANRLRTTSASSDATVFVPRAGLLQVLSSLVRNAFDATDGPHPVLLSVVPAHGMFSFVVEDDGHGMAPDILQRAGEPFYTTKVGKGTGLGLFLARMFAERCGGSLSLESDRGNGGTRATLTLPVSAPRLEVA